MKDRWHGPSLRLSRTMIVPTLQRGNAVLTLQRHPDGIAPSPGGVLFFACPKKRTRRVVCATPLRKGSPAAETTPVDGLRNRRGKNSLRSDSLPLVPGSAPRRPAQRQRAVFFPENPYCPEPSSWRGQRSSSWRWRLRGIVPTLQRGNGVVTLPRHHGNGERDCGRWRYRGQPGRI